MNSSDDPWGRKNYPEYLVFEGGGGKGAAYIGAIRCLEEYGHLHFANKNGKKRLDKVSTKGIAGSSAGAITAAALCAGKDSKDIEQILLNSARFEEIMKDWKARQIPAILKIGKTEGALLLSTIKMFGNTSYEYMDKRRRDETFEITAKTFYRMMEFIEPNKFFMLLKAIQLNAYKLIN